MCWMSFNNREVFNLSFSKLCPKTTWKCQNDEVCSTILPNLADNKNHDLIQNIHAYRQKANAAIGSVVHWMAWEFLGDIPGIKFKSHARSILQHHRFWWVAAYSQPSHLPSKNPKLQAFAGYLASRFRSHWIQAICILFISCGAKSVSVAYFLHSVPILRGFRVDASWGKWKPFLKSTFPEIKEGDTVKYLEANQKV